MLAPSLVSLLHDTMSFIDVFFVAAIPEKTGIATAFIGVGESVQYHPPKPNCRANNDTF
jgi:hypothetical protein